MDPEIVEDQMYELQAHGVTVVVISWTSHNGDSQSILTNDAVPIVLNAAAKYDVRIAFHLEPYNGRTALTVREDVEYIMEAYGQHVALYRREGKPMFYVYDSYTVKPWEWSEILSPEGKHTVRNTPLDAHYIGLWLQRGENKHLLEGGFDGFYTYFAATGTSFASTTHNWDAMAAWARSAGKISILSVGPGYDDQGIRPWNKNNVRPRINGLYYEDMWSAAVRTHPDIVSITSYNEWGEGTQIEPAATRVPRYVNTSNPDVARAPLRTQEEYDNYDPHDPLYYMGRTRVLAAEYRRRKAEHEAVQREAVAAHKKQHEMQQQQKQQQ